MQSIFHEHHGRYGSIRITKVLQKKGIQVNRKRVGRLLHELNLYAWNGNSFFDKFYKVQNFFPYAIPIVLDNEPPRM
ncbi:IS3 family transposase [Enterococcus gilvus]|uniref:IS3 family transposase n=1 Tax=Enterococcus gilvus TaxID=160453 RepID=UPI00352894BF